MSPPVIPFHLPPHRLLLVDDDLVLLETLTDLLLHEGFSVTTAASGEEAESLLASSKPPFDLVITDLVMPGKSGIDVLHKALEHNPDCTVLILTGFGSLREATEAVDNGAYGVITKPMHLNQFRNILSRIMERISLIQQRDSLQEQVTQLQARVDNLEATKGRMEMLASRINPRIDASSETLSDMERLASLKAKGMLTEEQFETAKKRLLSRWLS